MYLFIHYLIETDFELFMTSGDEILEYHAIGFLVYYYSYDDVKNELSKVKVIYPDFRIKSTTHLCFMGLFEKNRHYNLGY
jgi:hypothetical protein